MKVLIVDRQRYKPCDYGLSFKEGLKKHGLDAELVHSNKPQRNSYDLVMGWGIRTIESLQHLSYPTYIVAERGYLGNRKHYTSFGYNGLNGHANFCNKNMSSDRFEKHFKHLYKEWNNEGEYILLALQSRNDKSIAHLFDQTGNKYYQNLLDKLKSLTSIPILVREHPRNFLGKKCWNLDKANYQNDEDDTLIDNPIENAIENARWVVTVNSSSGVDATLWGKPCINIDPTGSMVKDIAFTNFDQINEKVSEPINRLQWAYNMSYTQWNKKEIVNGDAWDHLKRYYDQN